VMEAPGTSIPRKMTFLSGSENGHRVRWISRRLATGGTGLISTPRFEHRLTICLEIERGLANRARQKTGYAWRLIADHKYNDHAEELTFANIAEAMADCAQSSSGFPTA
jgi:hypothetical protein